MNVLYHLITLQSHYTCQTPHSGQGKTSTNVIYKNRMHCKMHIYTHTLSEFLFRYHEICMAHKTGYAYEVQIMQKQSKYLDKQNLSPKHMLSQDRHI